MKSPKRLEAFGGCLVGGLIILCFVAWFWSARRLETAFSGAARMADEGRPAQERSVREAAAEWARDLYGPNALANITCARQPSNFWEARIVWSCAVLVYRQPINLTCWVSADGKDSDGCSSGASPLPESAGPGSSSVGGGGRRGGGS